MTRQYLLRMGNWLCRLLSTVRYCISHMKHGCADTVWDMVALITAITILKCVWRYRLLTYRFTSTFGADSYPSLSGIVLSWSSQLLPTSTKTAYWTEARYLGNIQIDKEMVPGFKKWFFNVLSSHVLSGRRGWQIRGLTLRWPLSRCVSRWRGNRQAEALVDLLIQCEAPVG